MLTLTTPSALLALLGLLVPLAIHLWNRRPGREVAVGSLRWLAAGANRRLRNLRLEQLGLLLLRALLLAGLAVAVAGPAWWQPRPAGRGQVLVSPALAGTGALATWRPALDSLRRRGYALRWLSRGLPLVAATAWRADSLGPPSPGAFASLASPTPDTAAYYDRIWQAADTFPGQPLRVLTPTRLAGQPGTQRRLPPGLTWQTLPLGTAAEWLQAATGTPDSLYLVLGHSTERQTDFRLVRAARPQPGQAVAGRGLPALRYELSQQGGPRVQPLAGAAPAGSAPVPVRPARVRAWVYAPPAYAGEARYLRAALRAASVGLPGPLTLTVAASLPDTAAAPDWLFWLSAAPVPAAWRGRVRRGLHLWQAPAGPGTADTTLLAALELPAAAPATLWRRARLPAAAGAAALWTDAQGRAVLTRQALGQGSIYQAAIRLTTTWSTLPDNPGLPALLLGVLRPALAGAELARWQAYDQRRLDPAQLPLPRRPAAGARPPVAFRLLDLRPWLVLAVVLGLALERWLARRWGFTSTSLA
ncbi:MAG: hypothetical protein EOO59_01050 [Hymenobacter sp.]|nr:MAG: hypothetical protein EOO59_01050 [Hymenobacter sp.]